MKLFLCSHFSSVGSLIKEEIENKKVAFIPTASLREGYTGYVGSARKLFKKLGAIVTEIDISTEAYSTIQSVFEEMCIRDRLYKTDEKAGDPPAFSDFCSENLYGVAALRRTRRTLGRSPSGST